MQTLRVEVSSFSESGFVLRLDDSEELFVAYEEFPWFRDATTETVMNVLQLNNQHLHWPDLDIDLEVESIRHPELYPLISRR